MSKVNLHQWPKFIQKKYLDPDSMEEKVNELKKSGQTIVTLNGSFDLLHAGHLHILSEASEQGDIFIVALNTDRSIQEYKSLQRPIIPLDYRLQMVAAISSVDYVTWFDETDPINLLQKIKPNTHANGSEWGKNCIEAKTIHENGGKIHIVHLVPGLSTTEIINKIQKLN